MGKRRGTCKSWGEESRGKKTLRVPFEITYDWGVGNKERSNKGHRAGVSVRWKKMITSRKPGEEIMSGGWGSLISCVRCCKEVEEFNVQTRRLVVVTSKKGFGGDESRKLFHVAFAFHKTLLAESTEQFPKQSNRKWPDSGFNLNNEINLVRSWRWDSEMDDSVSS